MAAGKPWVILTQDPDGAASWLPALAAKGLSVRRWPAFAVSPLVPDALCEHFPLGRSDDGLWGDGSPGMADEAKDPSASAAGLLARDSLLALPQTSSRADTAWQKPCKLARLRLSEDESALWVYVLTSPAAVRVLANWLRQAQRVWPAGVWVGVPGRGTASVFHHELGDQVPMILPELPWQDGEHLAHAIVQQAKALAEAGPRAGQAVQSGGPLARVYVFNRPDGRTHWLEILQQQGIQTSVLPLYEVAPLSLPPAGFEGLVAAHQRASDRLHWLLGATAPIQTVSAWLGALPAELGVWARRQTVWVPHHRLVAVAGSTGFTSIQVYQDRQQLIERLQ